MADPIETTDPIDPATADPVTIDPAAHAALAAAHDRLKADAKTARDALAAIKTEQAAAATAAQKAIADAARASGDVEAMKASLEEGFATERATRDGLITRQKGQLEKLVIDNTLSAALDTVGVSPEFKAAVSALLRAGVEMREDDDGNPVAYRDGLKLADAVKIWAARPEGKAFVKLDSTGGGAQGGARNAAGRRTVTRAQFDKLSPSEQAVTAKAAGVGGTVDLVD